MNENKAKRKSTVLYYIAYYFFARCLPESYNYGIVGRLSKHIRVFFCRRLFKDVASCFGVERNVCFGIGSLVTIKDHGNLGINCSIEGGGEVTIGSHVMMGKDCLIMTQNHKYNAHGFSGSDIGNVVIGDRVWVGARCTILKGVQIGDDAIIGAGAVVSRDIPPRAIAVGVPARPVKFRPPLEVT